MAQVTFATNCKPGPGQVTRGPEDQTRPGPTPCDHDHDGAERSCNRCAPPQRKRCTLATNCAHCAAGFAAGSRRVLVLRPSVHRHLSLPLLSRRRPPSPPAQAYTLRTSAGLTPPARRRCSRFAARSVSRPSRRPRRAHCGQEACLYIASSEEGREALYSAGGLRIAPWSSILERVGCTRRTRPLPPRCLSLPPRVTLYEVPWARLPVTARVRQGLPEWTGARVALRGDF